MFKLFKKKAVQLEEKSYLTYNNTEEYYLLAKTFGWTLEDISKLSWGDKYKLKNQINKENELMNKSLTVNYSVNENKVNTKEILDLIKNDMKTVSN